MKKTPATRRVNTNPTFPVPDNLKISPKNAPIATNAYFLRNPKALQSTTGRPDFTTKTHSPRHAPSASTSGTTSTISSNRGFLSASAAATQQNQHLKTPRSFQSPVQKSPSYYLPKGKNSETNPDFIGTHTQARKKCSPISSEGSSYLNRKNSVSEYYPISLSIHFNGDKRQSITPNTKHTNYSVQYYPTSGTIPFGSSENTTRSSHEYEKENINFSKAFTENMKPDYEQVSKGDRSQLPEPKNLKNQTRTERAEKQVLTEIDLNSLNHVEYPLNKPNHGNSLSDSKKPQFNFLNIHIDNDNEKYNKTGHISERILYKSQESERDLPLSLRILGNCLNHLEKKGKYCAQNESDPEKIDYYCSKCAVDLALKGIKVLETTQGLTDSISTNQRSLEFEHSVSPKNAFNQTAAETTCESVVQSDKNQIDLLRDSLKLKHRNEELINFINRLEELLQRMKSLENGVEHEKTKAMNSYRSEKENIELFCKQLARKIFEHKENICRSLETEQSELIQQYDHLAKTPLRYLSEISQIKGDIEENIQNIMRNIEDKPYKRIMQKYEERFDLYETYFKEKEIALTQKMAPPKCQNTLENLKRIIKEDLNVLLGAMPFVQKESAPSNLGDFEGFMRCDEEISEMPLQEGLGLEINAGKTPAQKRMPSKNMTQNYTLISFENKDLFQNALNISKEIDSHNDSLIYETVHENDEECAEGFSANNENQKQSSKDAELYNTEEFTKDETSLIFNRKNSITKNSRYEDNIKKDIFEVLAVPLNNGKQLNGAFVNFIENKINEESSSPKGNFQKSLFTSPNFKELN